MQKKTRENIHEREIIRKADLLAVELAKAERGGIKLFSKILYRLDINPFDSINFILENQNIYFNEAIQESARRRTNTSWMKKRFLDVRKQLLTSSVPGLEKIVINDPLNLSEENFKGLESIFPVQGKIRLYKERLFSEDLQKILIIAEPVFMSTDIKQARDLVQSVEGILGRVFFDSPDIEVAWLAGHRFSVQNANTVRRDIKRIFLVSSLLILCLLWLVLRNIFSVIILGLPSLFGLALSFSIVSLAYGSISAIALGMAAILSGITIDYGIHILCHSFAMGSAEKAARKLQRPLILAASTTAIAFASLQFSRILVLRQLGIIAAICIICSAIFALYFLPVLISWFRL